MRTVSWLAIGWLTGIVLLAPVARSQPRPYIGYVYPAGGQQGKTFQIRLGGQNTDDGNAVLVTGAGVTTRIVEYYWRQNNQEQQLLQEQLQILKKKTQPAKPAPVSKVASKPAPPAVAVEPPPVDPATAELIARLELRTQEFVQTPASNSTAALVFVEVTIAPDAPPGEREIRLVTARGVSNPLPFEVGQLPEYSRKPMHAATVQTLGKEALALRKRPPEEAEDRIALPATLNGQIASGEVNSYRFAAQKGQRLLFSTQARQLIPFIADAVPGWFQPVLVLSDADGKEVAYNDDYRFNPDPAIFYEVPKDGEYVLGIYDGIYRGREDFVYRITAGELPFVTSIFPLGGRAGDPVTIRMKGWNLEKADLIQPPANSGPGVHQVFARRACAGSPAPGCTNGLVSNPMPFAMDTLPELLEKEPNNDLKHAQKVTLPVMINGRIDRPGDWDVFEFTGKANQSIVAEVYARRLDSPLDSMLKLTDATGKVVAFNDDHEDIGSGANTHHADSYLMAKLPTDGVYYVHIGDTAHNGGEEYAYRLRITPPQPDFELRVVPSSISLRSKQAANVSVYVIRKDGFNSPIKLALKDAPAGITSSPVTLSPTQAVVGLTVRTTLATTQEPFNLVIEGRAQIEKTGPEKTGLEKKGPEKTAIDKTEIVHVAVPAEDRMQAFLWRHLLPAEKLEALVFDPAYVPPPKHVPPTLPEPAPSVAVAAQTTPGTGTPTAGAQTPGAQALGAKTADTAAAKPQPKFTKQQVASRLRDLNRLYGAGFLTDEFYLVKLSECQVTQ